MEPRVVQWSVGFEGYWRKCQRVHMVCFDPSVCTQQDKLTVYPYRELYLWAATVFSSRSFPGKLTSWDYNAEATRCYDDGTTAALFPMIDCLNHRPKARITWQPGPDAMSLVSVDRMEAGTEVFNNYGPKANGERTFPRPKIRPASAHA